MLSDKAREAVDTIFKVFGMIMGVGSRGGGGRRPPGFSYMVQI